MVFLSICQKLLSTSQTVDHKRMSCHHCSTLNRWVQKVRVVNIVHFKRICHNKSQVGLWTFTEVFRIEPTSFSFGFPGQPFSARAQLTLCCHSILSHPINRAIMLWKAGHYEKQVYVAVLLNTPLAHARLKSNSFIKPGVGLLNIFINSSFIGWQMSIPISLSLGLLSISQLPREEFIIEGVWLAQPTRLTIWIFTEKFCQPFKQFTLLWK